MPNRIQNPDKKLTKLLPPQKAVPGAEYVPSRFALPFSHEKKQYVFHTLTKELLEAELPASCAAGEGCDELIGGYFLVPAGKDECAFYTDLLALMKACFPYDGPSVYTVLPTLACNARCPYCYEEGAAPETMSPKTAEQVIRYILETRRKEKPVEIRWFGGEPLLGVRLIDRICRALAGEGVEYASYMITNGSLITPEIIGKMKGLWNLSSIQISMDGSEEDYRARKRYRSDRDQYHAVMRAVSTMSEAGIRVTVRCNVDEENWPRIPRFLEEMRDGITHKENVSLHFAPLYSVRFGENDLNMFEKILAAETQVEAAGFALFPYKMFGMTFRTHFCLADKGGVVIYPDGSLYPCEYYPVPQRFGDVWKGVTDPDIRREFARTDQVRGKCRGCPFLPICTPFSHCPLEETDCHEISRLYIVHYLCSVIDHKREPLSGGNPVESC